jgi:PIN like domain
VKLFLDHNMSPAIARSLSALFAGKHEIVALSQKFPRTITDIEWINALSREGRWLVISGDRRITRNHAERHAFRASNLVGLFLAPALQKATVVKQAERILALWLAIESLEKSVAGGALFELPISTSRLRQMKN